MDSIIQDKLAELLASMLAETEPRSSGGTVGGAVPDPARVRRHLFELRDALDSLRVSVKYIGFDLDATRRENALLRKEIERLRKGGAERTG